MSTKTHSVRASEIERTWWVGDAEGEILGRLASRVAGLLLGKGKPTFAPHLEVGDNVIIINCEKIKVTGKKLSDKKYYRHSGYPGGMRETNLETLLATHPNRVITGAVKGMLPKNKLGRHALGRLHVYAGVSHPHEAQEPVEIEMGNNLG